MEKIYKLNKSGYDDLPDWVVDLESIKPEGASKEQIKDCLSAICFMTVDWHTRGWLAVCKLFPKRYYEETNIGNLAQEIYDYSEKQGCLDGEMILKSFALQDAIVEHAPRGWKKMIEFTVYAS